MSALNNSVILHVDRDCWLNAIDLIHILRPEGIAVSVDPNPETLAYISAKGWNTLTDMTPSNLPPANASQLHFTVDRSPARSQSEKILTELTEHDLTGLKILITAGPTVEDIDPVRFLSNRSTGKMGVALATAAARRGADVILIQGPLAVPTPINPAIAATGVRSAAEMFAAVMDSISNADVAIMSAAVADFTPSRPCSRKIKKDSAARGHLELNPTSDILATVASMGKRPFLVGFAAESENLIENARSKLERKGCDMICANDISNAEIGFGSDANLIKMILKSGKVVDLPQQPKLQAAIAILDRIKLEMIS